MGGTVTWTGSTNTVWSTAGNWSAGAGGTAPPASDDDVIIPNVTNDPVLDADDTINSLVISSGGNFDGNGNELTIGGENHNDLGGYAVNIDGIITGTDTDITIVTQATTNVDIEATAGAIRNLTINHASCTAQLQSTTSITGGLTITAGTLTTTGSNHALTVTGATIVGDGSSGANTATLTCNASTVSLGASVTSGWGLEVKQGGTFVGGSGAHTIGSLLNADHAHSIITLTSHASGTTLSSENAGVGSNGYALILYDDGVFDDADGLVVFTGPSSDSYVSGHNLHDVTINSSGNSIALQNGQTFAGNLTITAGTLTTRPAGTTENNALTVNGDCVVTGTLTLNDSTVAVGALRAVSGAAITQGSSGTLEITTGSNFGGSSSYSFKNEDGTSDINLGGTLTQSAGTYFDPRTAPTYASVLNNVVGGAAAYWIGKVTIGGTFTVNAGDKWQTYGGSDSFIVTGNVTLNGTLQATSGYLAAGSTGEMKFGSLTIASGGKYSATPLTTTITAETSSHAWNNTGGTFTHNNGKVKIYDATGSVMGSTSVRENTFYDLEISLHVATYTCSLYDVSGNAVTILNNLDVTKGEVEFSTASDTITIHGLTNITADAKFCDNAGHDTNKIIHNGLVTNLGTYNINDGTTVKLNGGIRQLGTLTVK